MEFPKTFAAAKRAQRTQWAIGDALLEEIGPPRRGRVQEDQFSACARELGEAGMPYSAKYLGELRNIAHYFVASTRDAALTMSVAKAAGTPAILERAREVADEAGENVTARFVHRVRQTNRIQPTATDLRRRTAVTGVRVLVARALKDAQECTQRLEREQLTASERTKLKAEIDEVLAAWRSARTAVGKSLPKAQPKKRTVRKAA